MQSASFPQPSTHPQLTDLRVPRTNGAQGTSPRQRPHDDTLSQPTVHSGRLIYAKPQDLPSFPSLGLSDKGSAAGAAASLGWANKKSPEPWRPSMSADASTAAVMAKDYKLTPAWQPAASSHGAKAALLASQSMSNKGSATANPSTLVAGNKDHGFSAANLAFRTDTERNAPRSPAGTANTLGRQKSLMAAKGAMANRRRSGSAPVPRESYPDESNAAANALRAATRAHRPAQPLVSDDAGAVPYTTMNRQMFTSRPPVKPEVDEQKRADVLHASAVAMAKKMFTQQQKMIDARKSHTETTSTRGQLDASSTVSDDPQPIQITNLQDAAYKQAQARLAKMDQENAKGRQYKEYYGASTPSRRFSVKGKLRRRSSSDGAAIEDRKRSQQIRNQMSLFSNKLSEVDDQKRQRDQEALLAAAQRNVHMRLKGMDEKISAETGMVPPSTLTQWELKAHAAAQDRSNERANQQQGRIDIGAGKYMDQQEIDAIAARRVQPVLDEINEKAEKEHARQTELRLEMEKKKEEQETEKARQKEIDDINKKLKEEERQEQKEKRAEEKHEAKLKREEEKAAKDKQKRLARSDKHKSLPVHHDSGQQDDDDLPQREQTTNTIALNSMGQPVTIPATVEKIKTTDLDMPEEQSRSSDERSPPGVRVKTWFKSKFSRGPKSPDEDKPKRKSIRKSFVGGAALTGMEGNQSLTSLDNRSASVRAVAMAGRNSGARRAISEDRSSRRGDPEAVSPMSSESEEEYFRDEARDQLGKPLTPPRAIRDFSSAKSQSPVRDSRFHEII
ncbi:hypothetical protein F5Y15DRAFT_420034 [Xylariaceae sp. FL0016]|nr:hypothetical protein F5Y15DRAFT_420034 [Xylariaceae sp. FL0016]